MGQHLPLTSYPAFRACSADDLAEQVETCLAAKVMTIAEAPHFDAQANHVQLPNSSLWFCSYGLPVALKFPEGDFVRVQFHRSGVGATWIGDQLVPVTRQQACISSRAVEIDFCENFQQVVWRIPRDVLVQKLAALTGLPVISDLNFEAAFQLETAQSGVVLQLLDCLLNAVETARDGLSNVLVAELEQSLLTAFLDASQHDFQDQLNAKPRAIAPWQVQRAETYIEQNWDKAITIEDLAVVTGASARSIFRTFQQSRGYTPLEFAKTIRLKHARRLLEAGDGASVTEVAFACGFGDLSRFSKDFAQAFGERPSAVLNRRKATAKTALLAQ